MIGSLQKRLLLGTGVVIALGLLIAGVAVYSFAHATLYGEFDDSLQTKINALAALTKDGPHGIELDFREFGFDEFVRAERPAYFQVWLDDKVLARSLHLTDTHLARQAGTLVRPDYRSTRLPDGRQGRQAGVTFRPQMDLDVDDDEGSYDNDAFADDDGQRSTSRFTLFSEDRWQQDGETIAQEQQLVEQDPEATRDDGGFAWPDSGEPLDPVDGVMTITWQRAEPKITIVVASETSEIDHRLASLRWILGSVGVSVTMMCLGLLFVVVKRGLDPLRTVSQAISGINAKSLDDRVSVENAPAEVAPIVERLNELLARLEQAFQRERSFSSDVAHELRTPLAGLRSTIEVYLSRPHGAEEYHEALETCLSICDQSQDLVETLLAVSRLEHREEVLRPKSFRVDELLHDCWKSVADRASAKGLHVTWDMADAVEIKSDREKLRVVFQNILGNAVSHSDAGGSIDLGADVTAGSIVVGVKNSGNLLSPDEAQRVFDRLWRGDSARAETGEHFGLGLTLAKRLTETLGGEIRVEVEDDIFSVTLSFPANSKVSGPLSPMRELSASSPVPVCLDERA